MDSVRSAPRKRRAVRANVRTNARSIAHESMRFTVQNLSAGGALLVGSSLLKVGQSLHLELLLETGLVHVECRVTRSELRKNVPCTAVQFLDVTAGVEDRIQEAVLMSLSRSRTQGERVAVIVDTHEPDAARLMRIVRGMGMRPISARTFLDALVPLQDPELWVVAVFADFELTYERGQHLLSWCKDSVPHVQRVLTLHPEQVPLVASDERDLFRALLKPISPARVAQALSMEALGPEALVLVGE